MRAVNVHAAKTHFSRILKQVERGQEIVIARDGDPVAKLVPIRPRVRRRFGIDEGVFRVPDDFDGPLAEDLIEDFER